ncbi:MAG: hypothetical protein MUE33_03370 [Cytophagaceae bacterium]|jgi:hypothetical protein|nr:hypothetical protein [Cytophagaceae bacterium]
MKYIIYLLFLLPLFSFADATPKFYNKIHFEIYTEEGKSITQPDSIVIFTNPCEDSAFVYTIYLDRAPRAYSDLNLNFYKDEMFLLEKRELDFLKLSIWRNSKRYDSPWIVNSGQRSFYRFIAREDGKLYDDSPPFYTKVSEYWLAFVMTIFLEMLYFVWLNRKLQLSLKKLLSVLLLVNVLSHPLLWWMHSHTDINILLLEIGIVFIESVILFICFSPLITYNKFFKWSLFSNLISWILGGILMFIMTTNF